MTNTAHTQLSQNGFPQRLQQPEGGYVPVGSMPDKPPAARAPTGSFQSAPHQKDTRPHEISSTISRRLSIPNPKRKTIHTTIHFKPSTTAALNKLKQRK